PKGLRVSEQEGEYVFERDGSVLVFVPGESCTIGREDGGGMEGPQRSAFVADFFIGKYEATFEQFAAFVAAEHYVTDAEKDGVGVTVDLEKEYGIVRRAGAHWRD